MTKIAYNAWYGRFSLSYKALVRYAQLKGIKPNINNYGHNVPRDDPFLIQTIEELGEDANGDFADLQIRDLPEGTKYVIQEFDGKETIRTINEFEWKVA